MVVMIEEIDIKHVEIKTKKRYIEKLIGFDYYCTFSVNAEYKKQEVEFEINVGLKKNEVDSVTFTPFNKTEDYINVFILKLIHFDFQEKVRLFEKIKVHESIRMQMIFNNY